MSYRRGVTLNTTDAVAIGLGSMMGTYTYGRERLCPWPGYLAGWGCVTGKNASAAAISMTCAAYVAPPGWERPVAIAAVRHR